MIDHIAEGCGHPVIDPVFVDLGSPRYPVNFSDPQLARYFQAMGVPYGKTWDGTIVPLRNRAERRKAGKK